MGGAGQISEKLMEILQDRVKLQRPVVRLDQSGENVTVETLNHEVYHVSAYFFHNVYLFVKPGSSIIEIHE